MSTRRDFLSTGLLTSVAGLASDPSSWAHGDSPSARSLSYRTLGKTGLKVTCVGFGCAITSDASVIKRAADIGINFFDTSRIYQHGNNERLVGAALKGKRQSIYLCSKTHVDAGKRIALQELDTSLRELGTDYLDVWCLHEKSSPEELPDDLLDAQQIARQQGKIRFTGVGTHNPKVMVPFLVKKGVTDVVMATYNFTMEKDVADAMAQAHAAGLGVVAIKVMAGGFPEHKPDDPTGVKLKREGAMLAALKWVLKDAHIDTALSGMTDMDQLEENMKAMTEPYSPRDEQLLARQLDFITPLYCRMCGECDGHCAKGLPVADMLRYVMYADGYGQFELGRDHFKQMPAELASVRCGDCATCTVNCRHGVKVRERLARAQEMFA